MAKGTVKTGEILKTQLSTQGGQHASDTTELFFDAMMLPETTLLGRNAHQALLVDSGRTLAAFDLL
nr:hypothetical protein [Marinospirillum sp.]